MAFLAALAPMMSTIATVATVAGTAVAVAGAQQEGQARKAMGKYEAQQLEIQADEEQAAAGFERDQIQRKKDLALSTLQTNAAASGFSATDPTALNLAEDIEEYGTLQEQMAMYGGSSRAAGRRAQAEAARMTGNAAARGASYRAAGTVLSGIGTIADRYNPTRQTGAQSSSPYHYGSPAGNGGWRTSVSYG